MTAYVASGGLDERGDAVSVASGAAASASAGADASEAVGLATSASGGADASTSAVTSQPAPPPSRHAQYGEHWGEGAARCFSLESDILDEDHAVRLMPVPDNFLCPISAAIMVDPVATVDGCVYERQYIERWFRERRQQGMRITSPITGLELPSATLMPLVALQRAIEVYLAHRPELKREHMAGRSFEEAAQILQTDLFEKQAVHATTQEKLKRLKQGNKVLARALQEAEERLAIMESERAAGIAPSGRSSSSHDCGGACGSCGARCGATGVSSRAVETQTTAVWEDCARKGHKTAMPTLLLVVLVGLVSVHMVIPWWGRLLPNPPHLAAPPSPSLLLPLSATAAAGQEVSAHVASDDWRGSGVGAAATGAADAHGNPAFAGQLEHLRNGTVDQKQRAAFVLRIFASEHAENQAAIARAGAIEPLIRLLQDDAPALREEAARALWNLARDSKGVNVANQRAIAKAGAMVPLVELLKDELPRIRIVAAAVLNDLATDNAENQVELAKAGAIVPLVRLLQEEEAPALVMAASLLKSLAANSGSEGSEVAVALSKAVRPLVALLRANTLLAQEQAASTLGVLAAHSPGIQAAIARAGAIGPLVERLHGDIMQGTAALALRNLAKGSPENQAAIVAEGAISQLVELLENGMPGVREEAAGALWNLASDNLEHQVAIVRAGAAIPLVALLKGEAQEMATIALTSISVDE